MLASPELESTGSKGHCVSFSYAMDGLSVDKLRVLLQPVTSEDKKKDDKKDNSETIEDKDSEGFEVIEIAPPKGQEISERNFGVVNSSTKFSPLISALASKIGRIKKIKAHYHTN